MIDIMPGAADCGLSESECRMYHGGKHIQPQPDTKPKAPTTREKRNAYSREYRLKQKTQPGYKEYRNEEIRKYRQRNPLKTKARRKLQYMVFAKRIERPTTCERCLEVKLIHAHHYDYNRAFDVLWLCRSCHEWLHHTTVGEALWA